MDAKSTVSPSAKAADVSVKINVSTRINSFFAIIVPSFILIFIF